MITSIITKEQGPLDYYTCKTRWSYMSKLIWHLRHWHYIAQKMVESWNVQRCHKSCKASYAVGAKCPSTLCKHITRMVPQHWWAAVVYKLTQGSIPHKWDCEKLFEKPNFIHLTTAAILFRTHAEKLTFLFACEIYEEYDWKILLKRVSTDGELQLNVLMQHYCIIFWFEFISR